MPLRKIIRDYLIVIAYTIVQKSPRKLYFLLRLYRVQVWLLRYMMRCGWGVKYVIQSGPPTY